jgi:hypothetical protein
MSLALPDKPLKPVNPHTFANIDAGMALATL